MKRILSAALVFITLWLLSTSVNAQSSFTITNQTGMKVTSVSLSLAGQNKWGSNVCTKDLLANNESFEFKQTVDNNNCNYDVKFMGEDGKDYYQQNVNLCSGTSLNLTKTDTKMDTKTTDTKNKLLDKK